MSASSWSLAARLTRLFLVSSSLFVLVVVAASSWFLWSSVDRELDALLNEEFEEALAALEHLPDAALSRELGPVLADLVAHHPENPLAWRVWEEGGATPSEVGHLELLGPDVPRPTPTERALRASGGRRWMSRRMPGGATVGLVLDGSAQLALLRRYALAVATLGALGLATIALGGRLVFGRTTALLEQVAAGVRAVRRPEGGVDLALGDAPREVRAIVEALQEMLANIRGEIARGRLFAAGMAHELRSPVQNLIGETEVALLSERSGAEYRAVLESNLEELGELSDAINNLIAVCSVGSAESRGAREVFDLGEEAELRLRRERHAAERAGVALALEQQGDLRLLGDRESLARALRNLVANAIEWTPRAGRVDVALRGDTDLVEVRVDDEGPGVPPHLRERIFEPFFRAANGSPPARRENGRIGYGLGLGMVRGAVLAHGGSIAVESSPSGGARFRIELPREAPEARPGEKGASAQPRA